MRRRMAAIILTAALSGASSIGTVTAQTTGPELVDPNLRVDVAVGGFALPTGIAFLDEDEMLVIEKDSGRVVHVEGDAVAGTALDLAVNSASERGLLGIALHPDFPDDPGVYLFWSCASTTPPLDAFTPSQEICAEEPALGADTADPLLAPLLGNRVDRFEWDGSTLTFDHNLVTLRSFQNDGGPEPPDQGDDATGPHGAQPARANHDGGVIAFGPDGKLYAIVGDLGRRGALQNLPCGPTAATCDGPSDVTADDQFGGPEADDAHLAGVILRLNADGTTPTDNPFFAAGAAMGGEVGANLQQVWAYGIRNSFGMAFDPRSGRLWEQENGDDSFSELNRVAPGMNSGWIQIMGPASRVAQFKAIETTMGPISDPRALNGYFGLQQTRWLPTNIADTPQQALSRLFMLPGAQFSDPELSWKFEVGPGGIGFLGSNDLGREYQNDLFMGGSRNFLEGGHLFRFNLTRDRRDIDVDDERLEDGVADNVGKWEITESESLLFGRNFGIGTDIHTGPDGELYVVSNSLGSVFEIYRR
jgi:glucose/arabinose dehydrogenase